MQFKLWNLEHAWQPVWCSCKISYDQLQIDVPHRYPTHVKGCSITGDVAKTLVSYSLQLQVTRAACCWWFSAFPHTIMMEYFWAWVLKKSSQTTLTCTLSNFPSIFMSSAMLHASYSGLADEYKMSFPPNCSKIFTGLKEIMQFCRSWYWSKLSARPPLIP